MNETPDGSQQPEPAQDPQELRLDARTLRGLAHPLRVRILGMLRRDGAATATGLAEKLGQSSAATSYHLRQLAEYGFIVEVEELGQGRERYWKSASRSTTLDVGAYVTDPELAANTETYLRAVTRMSADLVQSHLDEKVALPGHWQSAGTFNDIRLRLTPDQADELAERMWALVNEYPRADELAPPVDDTDPGEALRPVDVQLNVFPVPGDAR
ncbi:helix-turn-helix domain-containing protein [Angustibacter luteus]|uniref:Helix-turn-helix domain-containing protein n=1 Tax=Angustibacter luteus TaxID=658456 RepID=A0ABW1JCR9_9ACTN